MEDLCGYVVNQNFLSHQEMMKASLLWEIEEYRLGNGPCIGHLQIIHTSHIQLGYTFNSNSIFQKGKTPENAYLFASIESNGLITHNGFRYNTDELIVLDDKDIIDYTASAAADIITIAIEKDFFKTAFKKYFNEQFNYDKVHNRIQLKENAGVGFRAKARETLTNLMKQSEKLKCDPAFHEKTEQEILKILFQSLDFSREREKVLQSEIQANKAREYIEHHYKEHIEMKDLVSSGTFSGRTIRLGFNSLFGFSPKQYLKYYRLGKVQHALLQNDPSTQTTVENIAYDHGFTHIGRFCCQYKHMFGETPFTALKELLP